MGHLLQVPLDLHSDVISLRASYVRTYLKSRVPTLFLILRGEKGRHARLVCCKLTYNYWSASSVVKLLLDKDAQINLQENISGSSSLILAIFL